MNFLQQHCIYQDDDIVVIDKPVNLLTIPGKTVSDSVLSRLQAIDDRILLIHRLDRDTSGILVFALNKYTQSEISKQFQARSTEKIYTALLAGHLTGQGVVDIPVVYDPSRPPLHCVDANDKKPAITHWQVLEQSYIGDVAVSRVHFKPITGRSHQLRVHSQYLGHAIVGDTLYAEEIYQQLMPRLCLHATELSMIHPKTGQSMRFKSDVPF